MAGWKSMDFRSAKNKATGAFAPRPRVEREMVGGTTAFALGLAIKDYAAKQQAPIYKVLSEMDLGASTWKRMRAADRISQAVALKVVTFLGTSVSAVVTKYQLEKAK